MVPASIARATRMAREPSPVQIEPARPYSLSLHRRMASASSSNGMTTATGPNTSSRQIRADWSAANAIITGCQ